MKPRGSYDLAEVRELIDVLRTVRESRGWSQKKLAEVMGASQAWVCDVETGRHPDPQISTVVRMAAGLNVRMQIVVDDPVTDHAWTVDIDARNGAGNGR